MNLLKRYVVKFSIIENLCKVLRRNVLNILNTGNNIYIMKSDGSISRDIIGKDNSIEVARGGIIKNLYIRIRGNNNQLRVGPRVQIGPGCSIWMEGNNISIEIQDDTTITRDCQLCAQEDNTKISIGKDCMLSNNIIIRTSDSHPYYDGITGERLNEARNIIIGEHVWLAPNSKIMKGSVIGNGCIVGSDTSTNRIYPVNSLIVGRPARIVRSDIRWTREKLF